jgi:hypothetical protein
MLMDDLMALASLAGRTVVAAAATDAWQTCKRRFARLLGRDDPAQIQLAEQGLEQTRQQLTGTGAPIGNGPRWPWRCSGLPGWQTCYRTRRAPRLTCALVSQIQAQLPSGMVSAADHAVAAGRDVNISAADGGVAAGVIHVAGPGIGVVESGAVVASGGMAIGQVGQLLQVSEQRATAGQPVQLAPRTPVLAGREALAA